MLATSSGTPVLRYAEIASTNVEAMRLAAEGETGPVWIVADQQTAGKGRSGRAWVGGDGNLFASYLFETAAPIASAHQLSLVAGVAAFNAVANSGLGSTEGLRLKWPNDILIGTAKVGGILVESSGIPGRAGLTAVVGIGLNLKSHPDIPGRAVTNLAAHGVLLEPQRVLDALDHALADALRLWDASSGFPAIRTAWLARSGPIGERMTVHGAESPLAGTFAGLDVDGALLIDLEGGERRRCTYGDVTING